MKAFFSHSSLDKQLVAEVADQLGLANVELDSETFDRGLLNVNAIQDALRRSSLFVLFLSKSALASGVVRYEAMLANELYARAVIERFLVICLDQDAFEAADANWKTFNFVRKVESIQSIVRLIQHTLSILQSTSGRRDRPFVGRTKELHALKEQLTDPRLTRAMSLVLLRMAKRSLPLTGYAAFIC
jgi:TIR domain